MESQKIDPIVYEETPIIEPIVEKELPNPLDTPELTSHTTHGKRSLSFIGKALAFLLLFSLGVAGSTLMRPLFESASFFKPPSFSQQKIDVVVTPTPTITPVDETAGWGTYTISVGENRLSYKLPTDVVPPVCDGQACLSEGTYLPGGTRFTISSKTTAPIPNFEKLIVKDAGGRIFETKEATVSGFTAVDYSGSFIGRTTGGYTFTAMHGVMIQITPTITVEINHFAPNGITTEFEKDDALFSEILKTVTSVSTSSATMK